MSGDYALSGPQKIHQEVVPRIGGLGIYIGFLLGFCFLYYFNNLITLQYFYILLASLPIFAAGLAEDLTKKIDVAYRFASSICSGLIFIWLFDIQSIRVDVIYLDTILKNQWLTFVFLSFAISGVSNAYNIIDGINGLASMIAIICLSAILYLSIQLNDYLLSQSVLISLGAIFGFFLWNYPRGFIFLGDSGAYLIGFIVACLSILLVVRNEIVSPWFALLLNAYPILETIFTIWRRFLRKGKNVTKPDRAHLHSLIYRRLIKRDIHINELSFYYLNNAKTSLYLWILSITNVVPAILWWNSSITLMLCTACYTIFYLYIYRRLLKF